MGEMFSIKHYVSGNNQVQFTRYFDGNLWYEVTNEHGDSLGLEFPVPISDIGQATFIAIDRAILFMRYIRKQLVFLAEARKAQELGDVNDTATGTETQRQE